MKKTLITLFILISLTLAACGASSAQTETASGTNTNTNGNSFGTTPLPLASKLVVGTFKLEGTANAVTVEEATQLIPLWQVYKDLSASTTASQTEVDALADQIQGTLNSDQVTAIDDMKLTRGDLFKTMQDLGIAQTGRPNASGTPRPGGGGGGGNFQGFGGGNGAPGGGQGFGGGNGQSLTPQQIATFQARRAQGGGGGFANRIPAPLYDALIKLLQDKK